MTDNVTVTVEWVGKNDKNMWNLKTTGNEWYGFGRKNPGVSAGDTISFDFDKNGRWNNGDASTIEVIGGAAPAPAAPAASTGGTAPASRDEYWANKEARDLETQKELRIQGARTHAISIATYLADQGVIKTGAKGKEVQSFLAAVDRITEDLIASAFAMKDAGIASPDASPDSGYVDEEASDRGEE